MSKRTQPGAVWRIKFDDAPKRIGGMFGASHSLISADYQRMSLTSGAPGDQRVRRPSIIDEVVISPWLHVEQMDTRTWFVELCGRKVMVTVGRDGKAKLGEWYT